MKERIIYIPELQYECYFLGRQWEIVRDGSIKNISVNTFYGYPFYIIFENIETVSKQLITFTEYYNKPLSEIFPIQLILEDIIAHKQGYWLNLCIDFIIKMECLNKDMIRTLIETKHNKNFSQELRHKIRKMILLNNYEY